MQNYLICETENPLKCSCTFNEQKINEDYLNGKSYIKYKVKGKGKNKIFFSKDEWFSSSFIPPNEVVINNIKKSYVFYKYELNMN